MTTIDAPVSSAHHPIDGPPGSARTDDRTTLVDRIRAGAPYAVVLGGQGADWLEPLADLVRDHGLGGELRRLVDEVDARLAPVAAELVGAGVDFAPLAWVDAIAVGESAEDDDAPEVPSAERLAAPGASVPGILLSQVAAVRALAGLGLDPLEVPPVAVAGHSQGRFAEELLRGGDPVSLLAVARLTGVATTLVARRRGLLGPTMLGVAGVRADRIDEVLDGLPASTRVVNHLRNGRRQVVLSGPVDGLAHVRARLEQVAADEKDQRDRKVTGGAPFAPVFDEIGVQAAFHHPELAEVAELVGQWADRCGFTLDARRLVTEAVVAPVDWVADLTRVLDAGPHWILDLGPGPLATQLCDREARTRGTGCVAVTTRAGVRALTAPGAAPSRPTPWSAHAPTVVTLPDGSVRLETAFSRLTGRPPVLLAGMTPTTVDAAIVAAAANAGFWAELAGGGQVTEEVFADRVAELDRLIEPGRSYQFNSLFLDPYLWKLQVGQKRLVQRARAAGAPIDGLVVTAGVPELDEAVALVAELRDAGIEHVVFKPGTVRQIRQVLDIAAAVAPVPVIVQIEGGKAGGHHSWEDLDDLLITTYADLRARRNVVVCVGGGIGTPQVAASYLTGEWALAHDQPVMPVDGVLVGTAAMATAEATTSPAVKQLLVDTPGTGGWVGAGTASRGMASGRSQLGADIHEIDNAASRTGRLLDEVAGDADAVRERRDEIVAALDRTAKPFFGDIEQMTYAAWLSRFADLTTVVAADGRRTWIDASFRSRFLRLVHRAEARLDRLDHGPVATAFAGPEDVDDVDASIARLLDARPEAADVRLHPAEVSFFVDVCRMPGKPVTFVPVLDGDVRRWWRSDSLWQAHDARYPADAVCVIPGPVAVAGITVVDEPVADLLRRFEDTTIDGLLAAGRSPAAVAGLRRVGGTGDVLAVTLAAHDVVWAGRTVVSPVRRLGDDWVVVESDRAEHPATGSVLTTGPGAARLSVPVDDRRTVEIDLTVPPSTAVGAAPVVTTDAAVRAMQVLLAGAAGGDLPGTEDGRAHLVATWSADLAADHAGVTTGRVPGPVAPDALVGPVWPAVFAVLGDARTSDGHPVIEGMLDLVHLDHTISLTGDLPMGSTDLAVDAALVGVEDTEVGRVVKIEVAVTDGTRPVATLVERFALRGRTGAATLADPERAGGVLGDVVATPRRTRAVEQVRAPVDLRAFAAVTGDHNPIHTSDAAARLAGLGDPIVHGMWLSAVAQQAVGRPLQGWTTRFLAPLRPGATVDLRVDRVGLDAGAEVVEVTARSDGDLVMSASGRVTPPRTAYAFPGQGIQHAGMGMAGYQRSKAAREVWDRADAHTRTALGFSILTVVRDNPTTIVAQGTTHRHPDGVLFLTQFTQVAMAVLGSAQMAELREAGAFVEGAVLAGHSVGEYNALAAVSGVIPLEAVVEVVFQRGSVMHTLVERDEQGRSDYRLAAIRPSQIGLDDATVTDYVDGIAARTGEFLQIVNHNLRDSQYALAGSIRGLKALEADVAERRERFGGKGAFIYVPGIDVPFHSRVLHGGVGDFRERLQELLPATIDPTVLIGRYVPNLVPRPFSLERTFVQDVVDLVDSAPLQEVLADWSAWADRPGELCRTVLIELLAWQFASPVRWIETQDQLFTTVAEGGLGVERFVEIGVGQSPTVANLASSTLKLPGRRGGPVQVLNIERDALVVFATDSDPEEDDDVTAPAGPAAPVDAAPATAVTTAAPDAPRPDDLPFGAADATRVLIAWWTKMRPDQVGAADTIESLCDGASSRRNQLLVDLGGELALGAIDGAAEADMAALADQVGSLARGYRPFGPVLTAALGDHLKKVLGPTGRKQQAVTERVGTVWQLGPGWASHVLAALALGTREGASVRGGDLGGATVASAADVDAAIDAAVTEVGAAHGVAVALPSSGGGEGGTVDVAALEELTAHIAGPDGALASAARVILDKLGLNPAVVEQVGDDEQTRLVALVEAELGSDWAQRVQPAFDDRRAVLLDDRWASAREDVARVARGETVDGCFTGTGDVVARQADHWAALAADEATAGHLRSIAADAADDRPGPFAADVAVVTGASPGSIAADLVGGLLAGGATVVATSSSLSASRLRFFTELYRARAAGGARLWLVPANLASFGDVDAVTDWITAEQVSTAGGVSTVVKEALTPTLLFPFAAGRVSGDLTDAGSRSETDLRLLVWSVERMIGRFAVSGRDHDLAARLHVVLPGSPNRGTFGGDGAYGEAKAALDAVVAKWRVEPRWADRVTLVHALIGWVRGTGLMGGNDPLVQAVEAAGIRTWSTDEMAGELLAAVTDEVRAAAADAPVTVDLTGGLMGADVDLKALAAGVEAPVEDDRDGEVATIAALAPSPAAPVRSVPVDWASIDARPEDLVVVIGTGELGPYGSARTRFEAEVSAELSAAGVLELAWTTGLVRWENGGWLDTATDETVAEEDLHERFHDRVVQSCGVRPFGDDGTVRDHSIPLLASVYLENDLTFTVSARAEADAMRSADPERTVIAPLDPADPAGEWQVTRAAGTEIRVPRRTQLTRTVGGQIPTGFDPTVWGVPAEMVESVDRVALWNLVCTVDAFLSSGFTPAELMRWVHPALVANSQGTGMGGMSSMQSLYLDTLLGEAKANDILQEALPNVIAAHVVQSYVGSYGAMVHPVAACATTAVSVEEGVDKIRLGKADVVVAGGFDDLSAEGIVGFADMSATADTEAMRAKGIDDRHLSRANDRRRGGFVESQGGGTILLARGDVALRAGLPVHAVVAYAGSFGDGVHTSIPAPGIGALAAGLGGHTSPLGRALDRLGLTHDDIAVVSKHDTSTAANDPNESELHERLAAALGRSRGNPLFVVSQKSLTGHAKGGAAAFQLIGLCQVMRTGLVPPNRSLDCVDDVLAEHEHLVWLRRPFDLGAIRAGIVTSLGFGHVAGLIVLAHPAAFVATLPADEREGYLERAEARLVDGRLRLVRSMYGGDPMFERPADRRLGEGQAQVRTREAALLLDPQARLGDDGVYAGPACR
ncbi:MaoC-like protein [Aeromicrobium marinum DSM 15272]|uniref:MaoC-like protein n=1 Tax=Aeromicrobium marinum DSM 15272 TaxID=585531 RepID=E2SBC7_9ACTN|nr:type I polyketide synthase [Aeromicrobium marinum]EFQ83673.1 MaoC-like protein [Aeromicrobium marinum DSM 15272]